VKIARDESPIGKRSKKEMMRQYDQKIERQLKREHATGVEWKFEEEEEVEENYSQIFNSKNDTYSLR